MTVRLRLQPETSRSMRAVAQALYRLGDHQATLWVIAALQAIGLTCLLWVIAKL
jgi:hypothetical protein